MRKFINIITLLVIAGCSGTVLSGPAVIYNGAYVKALKDQFKLNNTANIMTGTDDPSSVANDAPKGSIYLRQGTVGELFIKQDAGSSTNWSKAPVTLASLTASRALQSDASGNIESSAVTNTELGYVSGVTGAIQTQLDTLQTSDIFTPLLGTPTYDTLKEYIETGFSAGFIYPEHTDIFTDNGDGTVNIAATRAILKTADNHIGPQVSIDVAAVTNLALTDLSMNYVVLEYNAGTPQITVSVVNTNDKHSIINVANIYRSGTTLHINESVRMDIGGFQDHAWNRMLADGFAQAYGGIISETGTRNIAVTAGRFWYGIDHFDTAAFDSSGADTFSYWYRDGAAGWTEAAASTQIDNTQYDDNSGTLATLANSRYGVHWIFLETDGDVQVIYGRGSYTLADSNSAEPPSDLPPILGDNHGFIVGKIIIKKSDAAFTSTLSTFGTVFTGATTTDHQTLTGLQGGTAAEYYHTTAAQHTVITQPASTTLSGYLTTGDWNSFDAKMDDVVDDITPQLGGNLDVNGQSIVSATDGDIIIAPNGTGEIQLTEGSEGVSGYSWISKDNSGSGTWARPPTGETNYIADNPSGLFDTYGWTESTSGQVDISATETASEVPREETTGTGLKIIGTGTTASEYAAFAFTIDDADVSKKLKISFSKKDLATYVAGEFEVVIIEDPAGTPVEITPATSAIPAGTGEFLTSFDTTATLSYEIRFRRPTGTSAASAGFVISDLIVGPGKVVQGAIVTEWAAYTPNTSGVGTPTIALASYSRVGDSTDIKIRFTAGTTTATPAQIGLPGTITGFPSSMIVGSWYIHDTATPKKGPLIAADGFDYLLFGRDDGTNQPLTAVNGDNIFTSGDLIVVTTDIAIPIAEWAGSGTLNQISDDVVAANARFYSRGLTSAQAITTGANNTIDQWNTTTDYELIGGGSFDGTTYTVPSDGWYELQFKTRWSGTITGTELQINIQVDGTTEISSFSTASSTFYPTSATRGVIKLTKDQAVTCMLRHNIGATTDARSPTSETEFSVTRLADYTAGQAVGFGLASATESGLMQPATQMSDAHAAKLGLKVYDASAATFSGNGITGVVAHMIPYQMQDGSWRLKLNIGATKTNSTTGDFTITDVESPTPALYQALTVAQGVLDAYCQFDTTDSFILRTSASSSIVRVSGDIALDHKPSWVD